MKGAESGSSPGSALRFEVGIGTDDFSPDNGVGGYCPYVSKETRLSGSPSVKDLVPNVPLNLESFDKAFSLSLFSLICRRPCCPDLFDNAFVLKFRKDSFQSALAHVRVGIHNLALRRRPDQPAEERPDGLLVAGW